MLVVLLFVTPAGSRGLWEKPSQFQEPADSLRNEISFNVGFPSPGANEVDGWRSTISLRLGYSRTLTPVVAVSAYVDYYNHRPILGGSFVERVTLLTPNARRTDLAAYATISLLGVLDFGAGTYYTRSDPVDVLHVVNQFQSRSRWKDSGFSEFRFLYVVGLGYDIPLAERVSLPVGLYYRNSYDLNNILPFYLRIGVGLRL
jgi:hypothetical protein